MAHASLRALLMNGGEVATNQAMVDYLQQSGALRNPECIAAFKAVDRGHFWVEGSGSVAYADMPLRHERLHQSAPHIYARALEALLPLHSGMSFLNIGSGTGYFSSLVGELIGESSINDGIDIWPESLAHAAERCRRLGKHSIEFTLGNVYEMDLNVGMRYDRIYLGACASSRGKYLHELLEVGGILVGPFEAVGGQQLQRVVRESETHFKIENLNSVHFASLVEPAPTLLSNVARPGLLTQLNPVVEIHDHTQVAGLPGVPFTFALRHQPWTPERHAAYPREFRRVVAVALQGQLLPPEIWVKHVLPWCPRWWFQQAPPPPAPPQKPGCSLAVAGSALRKALLAGALRRGLLACCAAAAAAGGRREVRGSTDDGEVSEGSRLLAALLQSQGAAAASRPGRPRRGACVGAGARRLWLWCLRCMGRLSSCGWWRRTPGGA